MITTIKCDQAIKRIFGQLIGMSVLTVMVLVVLNMALAVFNYEITNLDSIIAFFVLCSLLGGLVLAVDRWKIAPKFKIMTFMMTVIALAQAWAFWRLENEFAKNMFWHLTSADLFLIVPITLLFLALRIVIS